MLGALHIEAKDIELFCCHDKALEYDESDA
jgi:hypothetical protein